MRGRELRGKGRSQERKNSHIYCLLEHTAAADRAGKVESEVKRYETYNM